MSGTVVDESARDSDISPTAPKLTAPVDESADTGVPRAARGRSWTTALPGLAAILVSTGAFGLHALRYGRWIVDDAAITFAYARSIADGHGVVQQAGAPRVEGVSNPLWTALFIPLKWVGLFDSGGTVAGWPDYAVVPKVLGTLCFAGTLAVLWWAFRGLVGRHAWLATLFTGLGLAAIPSYVIWAVSGLENPLYGLLVAALAAVTVRAVTDNRLTSPRVAVLTGALALLAALTRPDGLVYVGAYPLLLLALLTRERLWASVRAGLISVFTFGLPMGAFLLARHDMFGLWLPNTAVAKGQQGVTLAGFAKLDVLLSYVTWPVVLITVAVVGLAIGATAGMRRSAAPGATDGAAPGAAMWPGAGGLLACLLLAFAAFGVLERDWMGEYRFATPIWVTATALFAVCFVGLLTRIPLSRRAVAVLVVVALASGLFAADTMRTRSDTFRSAPTTPMCWVVDRYGRLFNTYADRLGITEGTLALPDIGGVLLTTRLQVIDTAGLTDRTIARARGAKDLGAIGDYLFEEVKPTFIHLHGPWARGIGTDPRLDRDYVPIVTGDYVRRAAVHDPSALALLQSQHLERGIPRSRNSCGATMVPGSTAA